MPRSPRTTAREKPVHHKDAMKEPVSCNQDPMRPEIHFKKIIFKKKDSISKYSHILRSWGFKTST